MLTLPTPWSQRNWKVDALVDGPNITRNDRPERKFADRSRTLYETLR